MSSIVLTRGQEEGTKKILDWYSNQNNQEFKLAGYAGTGKSFMVRNVIDELNLNLSQVAFCAFTGKASLVLMRYLGSDYNVSTIHRLIYEVVDGPFDSYLFELKKKLFGIRLIVVDESSMVNLEILNDLRTFGLNILFIGDHGQLEAIGEQANLMKNPDHTLTEIMRQLEGDPLIHLSMLAREQKRIDFGKYGSSALVIRKHEMKIDAMLRADQVICGYNKTVQQINTEIRAHRGFYYDSPQYGDKIIFNRNNYKDTLDGYPITNGMIGEIISEPILGHHKNKNIVGNFYKMDIKADFLDKPYLDIYIPEKDFLEYDKSVYNGKGKNLVNRAHYGNAITCHKSQGDQFDKVYLINESFGDEPWRWLYTGITRAKKALILATN